MISSLRKQQGYATLLTTLIVLTIITIIVIYTAYTVTTQQKNLNNNYNQTQAIQAAEAGLQYGIMYFNTNYTTLLAGMTINVPTLMQAPNNMPTNTAGQSLQFTVSYTETSANPVLIQVKSIGSSFDRTTNYQVSSNITLANGFGPPKAALVEQGSFYNFGGHLNLTSDTGIAAQVGGGLFTSSGSTNLNGGIVTLSSTLSAVSGESYFESVFHQTEQTIYNQATKITSLDNLNPNNVTPAPQLLWLGPSPEDEIVNGTENYITEGANITAGTADAPVTLIIANTWIVFAPNANLTVNGISYFLGNDYYQFSNTFTMNINGAFLSDGDSDMVNGVTWNFNRNSAILNQLTSFPPVYAPIPGSWNDIPAVTNGG
jgi:Tfp pilus assembly protein PilX